MLNYFYYSTISACKVGYYTLLTFLLVTVGKMPWVSFKMSLFVLLLLSCANVFLHTDSSAMETLLPVTWEKCNMRFLSCYSFISLLSPCSQSDQSVNTMFQRIICTHFYLFCCHFTDLFSKIFLSNLPTLVQHFVLFKSKENVKINLTLLLC